MSTTVNAAEQDWQAALDGDKAAFRRLVEPCLDELAAAAQHEVAFRRSVGDLPPEVLTPLELVGEALLLAWRDRFRRPAEVSVRSWLLSTQLRAMEQVVRRVQAEERLSGQSLDAPIEDAVELDEDEEEFWEWPGPVEPLLWEDVLGQSDTTAESAEQAADRDEVAFLARSVLVLHDRHGVPLREVAATVHVPLPAAKALLQWARDEAGKGEETE